MFNSNMNVAAKLFVLYILVTSTKADKHNRFKTDSIAIKNSLQLSAHNYDPFMYQNENGLFFKGIEYDLIKTIAAKANLQLEFASTSLKNADILLGGRFPNTTLLNSYATSKPYIQDDLTWCVQKAKNVPKLLTVYFAATPEVWLILIFGVGYISGLVFYIMIQFDLEYKHRNQRDWHYTTLLIALPAVIGINQRFHPKYTSLRLFYLTLVIMNIFNWQVLLFKGLKFAKITIPKRQISTIAEIVDNDFHLAGSINALGLIKFDGRVISPLICLRFF